MASISSQLHIGETVSVTLLDTGCRNLTVLPPGQPGLQVIEIGPDYVVLDDVAAGVKTRLPVHLFKVETPLPPPGQQAA